jgi:DNA-binding NtrC family response regulator
LLHRQWRNYCRFYDARMNFDYLNKREILLLDSESEIRRQVANFFRMDGDRVEATDSAADALSIVLARKPPVVILGSDFDNLVKVNELVNLLRKCHRQLSVILVSDLEPSPLSATYAGKGFSTMR